MTRHRMEIKVNDKQNPITAEAINAGQIAVKTFLGSLGFRVDNGLTSTSKNCGSFSE